MLSKKVIAVLCTVMAAACPMSLMGQECMVYCEETSVQEEAQETKYSITYDMNGGTGRIDENEPAGAGESVKLSVWALKLVGYSHIGWTDGVNTYERGQTIEMPDHDLVLTAVYKKLYTLTYEDISEFGYDLPVGDQTVAPGTEIHLGNYGIHKGDAAFNGWLINGVHYNGSTTFIMPEEDVHIAVDWLEPIIWTFSSGINDKYCSPDVSYQRYPGMPSNLPDSERLSRVGYKLTGWYDKENDIKYSCEDPIVIPDHDKTFYAIWTPTKVGVAFDANGGQGSMARIVKTFGESFELPECTFTKEGYKLLAWKSYDNYFYPEETVSARIEAFGDSMKCSAVWIEDNINPGDIDNNGKCDMSDLTYLSLYLIGDRELPDETKDNADIIRDKTIDISDLAAFKQYISMDHIILGLERE